MLHLPFYIVDPSLGHLDYESLSDQSLMEMLVTGMDEASLSGAQDANGNFKDVCEWKDVRCTNDRVTKVFMYFLEFTGGQFAFEWIPPLVRELTLNACGLRGTLDTAALPPVLVDFQVPGNRLHGELDWKALPRKLEKLIICRNEFTGSCVLADLPDTLIILQAEKNKFSGVLNLEKLPAALKSLDLCQNELHGSIHIEGLPQSMGKIALKGNAFTGDLRIVDYPESLQTLAVEDNRLSGTAVLSEVQGRPPHFLWNIGLSVAIEADGSFHEWQNGRMHMWALGI